MERISIIGDPKAVGARLTELGLTKENLLRVRDAAFGAAGNATNFHPANAAGTFGYHEGTFTLRDMHVGNDFGWSVDRTNGVEGIWSATLRTRVVFTNVDVACCADRSPKPRSTKGVGAERTAQGNLFGVLPEYAPSQTDRDRTYYLMMDSTGALELSLPIVEGGTFKVCRERIFLSDAIDDVSAPILESESSAVEVFDPEVRRK